MDEDTPDDDGGDDDDACSRTAADTEDTAAGANARTKLAVPRPPEATESNMFACKRMVHAIHGKLVGDTGRKTCPSERKPHACALQHTHPTATGGKERGSVSDHQVAPRFTLRKPREPRNLRFEENRGRRQGSAEARPS